MSYILVGNYGVSNAGDEILRSYFLDHFPECDFQVLSASPREGELSRLPAGLRSLLSFRWLKTLGALRKSQGMVFGGGSLFTDIESSKACFIWFVHAYCAWILRKPYYLAFQGIGPFRTHSGENLARWVIAHAAHISVRDSFSYDRLKMWKKNTEVVQTFDPSITLLEAAKLEKRTNNVFILIPKFSLWKSKEHCTHFINVLSDLQSMGQQVQVLSLQPDNPREKELCNILNSSLDIPVMQAGSMHDAIMGIEGTQCVISQRYHGLIAALICGVPFVALPQGKGDKLDALASLCGCPSPDVSHLSSAMITEIDWESLRSGLASHIKQYRALAQDGEMALKEVLS